MADVDVGLHNVEIMEEELADKTPICVIQVVYKDGNSKLFVNAETGINAETGDLITKTKAKAMAGEQAHGHIVGILSHPPVAGEKRSREDGF